MSMIQNTSIINNRHLDSFPNVSQFLRSRESAVGLTALKFAASGNQIKVCKGLSYKCTSVCSSGMEAAVVPSKIRNIKNTQA